MAATLDRRYQLFIKLKIVPLFVSVAPRSSPLIAAFVLAIASSGLAQTLDITGGIHTYVALSNTTVNLSGQCELHLTATNNKMTTVTPMQAMPGCVIHLNSEDAWLFLDGTRPYNVDLTQIRVNGALAVDQVNVRLVQYGMGSVVIPHSPDYLPLQVFTGSQFTGSSAQASIDTYYSTNSIYGSGNALLNGSIGSFILKRGYRTAATMLTPMARRLGWNSTKCMPFTVGISPAAFVTGIKSQVT